MGFLNPIFLLGIVGAVVPLLIHLWSRRQAKAIDFSSLRFLRVAHRRNVRRIQLRHLLILILRMLIIACVAFALARPLLKNQFSFAGARAKTSAVIVLDNSYSMAYQDIQGQRFEQAKQIALEVADSLQRGDSAAVVLMSDVAAPVFRKLTSDLNQVEAAIRDSQVSYRSTFVPPSLELAHEILNNSNDPNKELYLITDLGRNGWTGWGRIPNRSNARIFLLSVGGTVSDNVAIEEVKPDTQLMGINLPVRLAVTAHNYSDAPLQDTVLNFFMDGEKRRTINLNVPAGAPSTVDFVHRFASPGAHTGYVELQDDRLTVDNRRYFVLNAFGQIRVLCVGEQTLYLTLAMNPAIEQRPNMDYTILPSTTTPAQLEDLTLTDYDVVVMADVPTLSSSVQQKLQAFMRDGKSVVYFIRNDADVNTYNTFAAWLPANVGEAITWRPPQAIAQIQAAHPIFEVFHAEDFSGQYGPRFYRGLTLQPAEDAHVIAALSDGTPLLIERVVEAGTAFLFNVSASQLEASDLLAHPHFLPLLQQTVLYAVRQASGHDRNVAVGQSFAGKYQADGATTARIQRLNHPEAHDAAIVPLVEDGSLVFSGTDAPGLYQVEIQTGTQLIRDFFAVNVDTTESEAQAIPVEEAANRIDAETRITPTPDTALNDTLNTYRVGKEIWGELLVLALILMLVEGFLSNQERASPEGAVPSRA